MFFQYGIPTENICAWLRPQIDAAQNPNGIDVVVAPHKKIRTVRQNKYLMKVCAEIVRFYHETGFMPSGCPKWAMQTQVQKEFWKGYFGVLETHKLSTRELGEFVDKIQAEMVQQTGGEYQPIVPDSDYLISLVEGGNA